MGQSFHKIDKCFDYLRIKAGSEIIFQELLDYTSWSVNNLNTNISKRIREFLIDTYPRGVPIKDRKMVLVDELRYIYRKKYKIEEKE